jgi:hypothetical protein
MILLGTYERMAFDAAGRLSRVLERSENLRVGAQDSGLSDNLSGTPPEMERLVEVPRNSRSLDALWLPTLKRQAAPAL